MEAWNLPLATQMLLGASIASFLLVGKHGFKQVRLYLIFAIILNLSYEIFLCTAPVFIFFLVIYKNGKVTPPLFWVNAVLGLVSIVSILRLVVPTPHFILINNVVAVSILTVAGTLCIKQYKNYVLAFTLVTFIFFWSAYGNVWHPVNANISMPYACLSLLIFLYLHVIKTKFAGSAVHMVYKHVTKRRFKSRHRDERVRAGR